MCVLPNKLRICTSRWRSSTCKIVEWAFGKRMTPAERLRKHQRALEKTQRELGRERVKLENQEKNLVQEIKKSAKNGQIGACKIQAKDLVRTRRYVALDLVLTCLIWLLYCYWLVLFLTMILLLNGWDWDRYIQKFYQMRTQLQAISLRIQVRQESGIDYYISG